MRKVRKCEKLFAALLKVMQPGNSSEHTYFQGAQEYVQKYTNCFICQSSKQKDTFKLCLFCVCSTPNCENEAVQHGKCMSCDLLLRVCCDVWCWQCNSQPVIYCGKDTCFKMGSNLNRLHFLRSKESSQSPGHLRHANSLCNSCLSLETNEHRNTSNVQANFEMTRSLDASCYRDTWNLKNEDFIWIIDMASRLVDQGGHRKFSYRI